MAVRTHREGRVCVVTLDDGKRNALPPSTLRALGEALDVAERDALAVVLTGREGVLSAGFDLKVMRGKPADALTMLRLGFGMTARLLSYPFPVVVACPGHAYAMGLFLALSADFRYGVPGPYTLCANEVAIGLPLPRVAAEVMRLRLTPSAFQRAAVLSEGFDPEQAVAAGLLDALAPADTLVETAVAKAKELLQLDAAAHRETKLRVRHDTLVRIRRGLPLDLKDAVVMGARAAWKARK